MKNITLKWFGILATFFSLGNQIQAQDYKITEIGQNLTNLNEVTEKGIPVVLYNTGRPSYVYIGKWNNQPTYVMSNTIQVNENSSGSFVFFLKKEGEFYKFEDAEGNNIPKIGYGTDTRPTTEAGLYTISQNDNGKWLIKNKDDNNYFNGNGNGSTFTGWNDTGANSQYEIKSVTIETHNDEFTVKYQNEKGKTLAENTTVTSKNWKLSAIKSFDFRQVKNITYGDESLTLIDGKITKPNAVKDENTAIIVTYADNVPFLVSESYEQAKWQILQMHNNKGVNETFVEYESDDKIIGNRQKNIYDPKQYWCFIGNVDDGFKLYNKVAGETKVVTFGGSQASLTNNTGDNTFWEIKKANPNETVNNGDKKFSLKTKSANTGNIYLNMQPIDGWTLKYWNAADDGSTIVPYSVEQALTDLIKPYNDLVINNKKGVVGSPVEYELVKQKIQDFLNVPSESKLQEIEELCENKITFDPVKYYRIENYNRRFGNNNANNPLNGGYLESADNKERTEYKLAFYANVKSEKRASAIWKITGNETDGYTFQNLNSQKYLQGKDGDYLTGTDEETLADKYSLTPKNYAQYNIKKKNSEQRLHASGAGASDGGGVMYYNQGEENSPSAWFLIPAENIELSISDAGYATVNYPFAVQLPKELTAYTGTANAEKSKFMLEEIQNGSVPANTPVVIEGPKGIYSLTIDYENQEEPILKDLKGSLMSIEITTEDYILAKDASNIVGFYKTTEGGTLAQNKAYIESTPAIQAVRGFGFSTEGDGTTGIENTVTETEKEEYYDLQGRRILNPTKGIYVTKSGKKVLFIK